MEGSGKKMRAICVMLAIMLAMFASESEAFSGECYDKCLLKCVNDPHNRLRRFCPFTCIRECLFEPLGSSAVTTLSSNDQLHNKCTLGCATTKCAHITLSAENIRGNEVEDCVNNCSNTCIKKH